MEQFPLQIKVALQVQKPVAEVFEAIVDPSQMTHYFIEQSNGRMEEGGTLQWKFPEMDMLVPVRVGRIEKDKYISYYWDGEDGGEFLVEMHLTPYDNNEATVVTITEKGASNDAAGIKWLQGNTEGWANFLACLKAWKEYGIKPAIKFSAAIKFPPRLTTPSKSRPKLRLSFLLKPRSYSAAKFNLHDGSMMLLFSTLR
ncbi:MAG: hypothetical protein EOO88_54840 [Pedobacter sp.]|nr:MAG: hypothetical protein EOO88_54840 [Pedobacter sp.]